MAVDYAQVIRDQTPYIETCDGGTCRQFPPGSPEYESWLAATVAEHVAAQERADLESIEEEERRLLRLAAEALQDDITALEGGGTLTARQQRDMLARTDRILLRLGRVLVKKGIL